MASAMLGSRVGNALAGSNAKPHNTSIAFAPDGATFVVGSQAGVQVRDSKTLAVQRTISVDFDSVHDVRFSPDGTWLVVAGGFPGESGEVSWMRWPTGEVHHQVSAHGDVIHQVAFSPNGDSWVTASADEVCSVFALNAKQPATRFTAHSRSVLGVTILPDGETVVSGSRDETLRVWKLKDGASIRTLHNHSGDVTSVVARPKQQPLPMVASASTDRTIRFWQPTIGRMVRFARIQSKPLGIAWILNGSMLAAACDDGYLRLIDPSTVTVRESISMSDDWLYCIGENPHQPGRVVVGGAFGALDSREFSE